jgi:hypothetical protein
MSSAIVSRSCFPIFYSSIYCVKHRFRSHTMAGEAGQNLPIIAEPVADDNKSDSGMESDVLMASSSANMVAVKIVDKVIPDMSAYWKKSTLTEADVTEPPQK